MADEGIARIAAAQIPTAGVVLARAFQADPLAVHMIPDSEERAALLPMFYEAAVRVADRFGEVFVAGREVVGSALWFPPGLADVGPSHFEAVGAGDLPDRLPPGAFDRFTSVIAYLDSLRGRDIPEPHWYLAVLGVEPQRQGRGIGSTLVHPVLERADTVGIPCYLETQKAENVPFYLHLGFRVVVESREPLSTIRFWTMRRDAKRAGTRPTELVQPTRKARG